MSDLIFNLHPHFVYNCETTLYGGGTHLFVVRFLLSYAVFFVCEMIGLSQVERPTTRGVGVVNLAVWLPPHLKVLIIVPIVRYP